MRRVAAGVGIALAFAMLVYGVHVSFRLRSEAVELAGDQPWCLQVAPRGSGLDDPAGYRPVRGFVDTLGVWMRGRGAYHHAVLVVGDLPQARTWHWSYWKRRFVDGSYGWPQHPVACTPMRDYLHRGAPEPVPERREFWFAGARYSIPRGYRASLVWPSASPGLMFAARAPDFAPAREWCVDRLCNFVSAHPARDGPQVLFDSIEGDGRHTVIERGQRAGLEQLLVEDERGGRWRVLTARDGAGRVTTAIRCFESDRYQCGHSFVRGRWRIRFHHMPADLDRWRQMQDRLAGIVDAFAPEPPS
ncbi:hypothetical protein [Pseudoxanthomonas sp. 10H]|uniref:hypothetical protein n=1 Tax=Pseudoxanthomonas sp. 10H TaxID=3242729 RepID=UPI003556ACAF